jgi:hypothetical protein
MIELADDRGGRTDAAGSRHRKERDVATETQRAHEEDLHPATATRRPAAVAVEAAAGAAQIALTLVGAPLLRRAYRHWGATPEEQTAPMPGDGLVGLSRMSSTRAVSINVPPDSVWPWLAQIGHGRGGLYSFDGLENLIGWGLHSADRILGEHQELVPGDLVRLGPDGYPCYRVVEVKPGQALVLQGVDPKSHEPGHPSTGGTASTWQWMLRPLDGGTSTRLITRQRLTYPRAQSLLCHVVEPIGFVMERRMLLGIKARAEGVTRYLRGTPPDGSEGVPGPKVLMRSLQEPPSGDSFSEAEIDGLPEAVRRYFLAAIAPGTPLAAAAVLRMRGALKLRGRWLPFRARQVLAPHRGFVWTARVSGLITGSDRYADGAGAMDWRILGIIPLVHAFGEDISRSAAARGPAEAVLVPTTLLPRFGVAWSATDAHHITARYSLDATEIELRYTLDGDARLRSVAFDRWGDPDSTGHWGWHPAGFSVTATATLGGLTIPSAGRFGWFFGIDRWPEGEFFRFQIRDFQLVGASGQTRSSSRQRRRGLQLMNAGDG